ncbi:MAG: 1-(5-phosphoribosyl)-5-[(5-phosphoribosylamino) methylideneamino] imidazole-4-carboxamide isomerase [Saprospiraceae bacterium]|nr:MAG: 1-(5-phosphoribosyl)-5-[(5-phosphoribosylamino) methylideneamino] imidazole-4-carboxamide isomerase [Saprospiraceae bacterium]
MKAPSPSFDIIPAMDLMDGCCVRLLKGNFEARTVYSNDPLGTAKKFESMGYRRLHIVDLDGARAGSPVHLGVLEQVASQTDLEVDFSGGIRTEDDVAAALEAGARWVAVGSVPVVDFGRFEKWVTRFGADSFLPGLDVRGELLAVKGWQEQTQVSIFDFLRKIQTLGIDQVFVTSIERDGAMQGPDLSLYRRILEAFPSLSLIASGGVRHQADLQDLEAIGCVGAIVGRAVYGGL